MVKKLIFLFSSALLLIVAALYNGYPLVYSDTSTYLSSGFELETPIDRPITYGLFLRLTSLNGISLWLTVFFQSLLLVFLIKRLLTVLGVVNLDKNTLLVSFICVFTTGISCTSSQLIADVFTPMLILLWILLCIDKSANKKTFSLYCFLLFLVSSMHMSHFIMSALFSFVILAFRINKDIRKLFNWKRIILIFIVSGLSFIVFSSSYSKFKHVFFVAKLSESGLLKTILNEQCPAHHFNLCAYKDSLPATANDFMWDKKSPLEKLGGYGDTKQEFDQLISISLTTPKYLKKILTHACKDSYKQLYTYNIRDGNGVFMEGTKLYNRLKKYVPYDINLYKNSLQQTNNLFNQKSVNIYLTITLLFSVIGIIVFYILKKVSLPYKIAGLILFLGIIINDVICASLAPVSDRFGCRVVWLVVFYFLLLLIGNKPIEKEKEN